MYPNQLCSAVLKEHSQNAKKKYSTKDNVHYKFQNVLKWSFETVRHQIM